MSHKKLDPMLALSAQWRVPVVLFVEGGGGRPNDIDVPTVAGLDTPSFLGFAALSGLVPTVGIASGRCFAGNAALLGCCDVIIATEHRAARAKASRLQDTAHPRDHRRRGLDARAATLLWAEHRRGARADRGPVRRRDRQRSVSSRRRGRFRRRRQGCSLLPAVRRLRVAADLALRHAGLHGGPAGGDDGDGAPRVTHVRRGREPFGAAVHRRLAERVRPRRAGYGGRPLPCIVLHRLVADRRVRGQ